MSERMTNEEVGRHIGTAIAAADATRRTESAVALSREIARAHTSEEQKDATIKALADALEMVLLDNGSGGTLHPETVQTMRAALRLAGRLP